MVVQVIRKRKDLQVGGVQVIFLLRSGSSDYVM